MEIKATETIVPPIATEEKVAVDTESAEARIAVLEAEKATILEREQNYKKAYLKEVERARANSSDVEPDVVTMEEVAKKVLAESRIAEIVQEKEAIIKQALKENKELKLASMNKPSTISTAGGSHSESFPVRDTLISPEQMAHFKSRNWSDKDIERYKRNLQKRM